MLTDGHGHLESSGDDVDRKDKSAHVLHSMNSNTGKEIDEHLSILMDIKVEARINGKDTGKDAIEIASLYDNGMLYSML